MYENSKEGRGRNVKVREIDVTKGSSRKETEFTVEKGRLKRLIGSICFLKRHL